MAGTEHPLSGDPVLDEIRATREDIRILNVRLFGTEDGSPGDGGRLVAVEKKVKNHNDRITWLERIAYGGLGAVGVIEFLHVIGVLHLGK